MEVVIILIPIRSQNGSKTKECFKMIVYQGVVCVTLSIKRLNESCISQFIKLTWVAKMKKNSLLKLGSQPWVEFYNSLIRIESELGVRVSNNMNIDTCTWRRVDGIQTSIFVKRHRAKNYAAHSPVWTMQNFLLLLFHDLDRTVTSS